MESKGSGGHRPRKSSSKYITTKSGKQLRVNRTLTDKMKARRENKALRKAERLRGLPKSRFKRTMWRLQPKRLAAFWFSRDGLILGLKITGIGIIAMFILLLGVFAYFRKDLPNLKDISGVNIGGSIRYYDRTGSVLLWEDYGAVKRNPVESKDIPQNIKDATVAIEDRNFYNHRGFDAKGIVRAGFSNVTGSSGGTQGGSTITQQLVKLTQDWSKDRTYKRKIKELILAVELERTYTKSQILTSYLNVAPYGGIEYGIEAASEDYFHKPAKDLTLDEASMLAAIPKSPKYYSPYSPDFDRKDFIGRQHYILDVLVQSGKITKADADKAKLVDTIAKVQPRLAKYDNIKAPYFVLAAKQQLIDKFVPAGGEGSAKIGGWKVTTTLDLNLQQIAEEQVQKGLNQIKRQGGDTAAFAAEDVKTGQMVAVVGGVDFTNKDFGQNNYAQLPLPPGSSFKPYDYATLIDSTNNFGAGSVLYDSQGALEGYPCTNKGLPPPKGTGNCLQDYDFRYPGPLTLRYALGGSRNVPAVKAMLIAGEDKVISTAEKMGLKSGYNCYDPKTDDYTKEHETQCYSSAAIGDGAYLHLDEHVHGYSTLSREGVNIPQTYILKIENAAGKVFDEYKQSNGTQAIRPEAAYIVDNILSDPNASYFPAGRKPHRFEGWKFAMKTGTTNDGKDGWMMGFSTKYAAGVWVGYHTRTKVMSGTMENMTQPIWQGWMDKAHTGQTPEDWSKPAGLQTLPAFIIRSHVGIGSVEPSPTTDLFPSWYKSKAKNTAKRTIDRVSNKLATDCTPSRARQDITDLAADSFSGDTFVGGSSGANTSETDDVHKCDDIKPSVTFSVTSLGDGKYQLNATASAGTHPLNSDRFKGSVSFTIDGAPIPGCDNGCSADLGGDGTASITFNSTFDGSKDIQATVVDSVLYDASSTVTTDLSQASSADALTFDSAKVTGANTKFNWSGGVPPYVVYRSSNNNILCPSTNSSNCQSSALAAPPGVQVYVKDSNGTTKSTTVI